MRKLFVIVALLLALVSATPVSAATSQQDTSSGLTDCLHYKNHVYEACYAYIVNNSYLAVLPYYQHVHSSDQQEANKAAARLELRVQGNALQTIQQRTISWPAGDNSVPLPKIKIISAKSSLATNSATLVTQESWTVYSAGGQPIYQENKQRHIITLSRVIQVYILGITNISIHKWVTSSIN